MFLSPRKDSLDSVGDGAQVLAVLTELTELLVRWRDVGRMVGDDGSNGAMRTLPATSETRCCDERRRGRGSWP